MTAVCETTSDQQADGLYDILSTLTETAAQRALEALITLDARENDADHDRGARSVECLMRVASTAQTLKIRLQKDADANEEIEVHDAPDERLLERDAQKLAEKLNAALDQIGSENRRNEETPGPSVGAGGSK